MHPGTPSRLTRKTCFENNSTCFQTYVYGVFGVCCVGRFGKYVGVFWGYLGSLGAGV